MMHPTDMLQDIETILISPEDLQARIREMGRELAEEYRGKDPVVVGILKGVVPFYAALTQSMDTPMLQDFMVISSYAGSQTTGTVTVRKDLGVDIRDKDVLLLEDIVDSGFSLSKVVELLRQRGPKSIRVCTLLDKPTGRRVPFIPDKVGFTVPDAFVVGFGLDYNDHYRNLPFVGVLKKEVYTD